ncbi:MAG: protein arginine kinase [Candidatus Omnitrophica bacterium]|nr:protein arginine kinase [Candidatus Omnitrophota bacterium]
MVDKTGEWLKGKGPSNDVVISSRVRLARNLAGFIFSDYMPKSMAEKLVGLVKNAVDNSNYLKKHTFFSDKDITLLDKEFFKERHLISGELVEAKRPHAVCFTDDEIVSIMINEEDHLRLQVLQSGFNLVEALRLIDVIDAELENNLDYAFSPTLGYLTACPTNVGTGLRASCMLHLPALVMTKQINKVLQALSKMSIAVRGLYGEGTQATGNFFQFSNQITLGRQEEQIVNDFEKIVKQVIEHEQEARIALSNKRLTKLADQIWRSLGILRSTRIISSGEANSLLSLVRLGCDLGLIKDLNKNKLNELFIVIQPAHLQKIYRTELPVDERDEKRASLIREKLKSVSL